MNPAEPSYFGRDTQKDYFFYVADVAVISVAAPLASTPITFEADSDFYCIALTYQADIDGATLTEASNVIPLVDVEMQDTGSGRIFMNAPTRLSNIAGDGKRPYRLIRPRRFAGSTTLNIKWTNRVVGGTVYRIQFVLHGYKIYNSRPVPV